MKNKDKSMDAILRDTKHNRKAEEVLLKLLAKQKSKHKSWDEARVEIYPVKEIKEGGNV